MRSWTIALLFGVVLFQQLPTLPTHSQIVLLLAALVIALPLVLRYRGARLFYGLALGFLWSHWHAANLLSQQLLPVEEGQDLQVSGWVADIPVVDAIHTRFLFEVEHAEVPNPTRFPQRITLSWYQQAPHLVPGDHLTLTVRLKRPWGSLNPGSFDYEQWLLREGIRATGYVRSGEIDRATWHSPLQRLRAKLFRRLSKLLEGEQGRGILLALAMGERQEIDQQQWNILTSTGTNHLVAVSGLHVGIVSSIVFLLFRTLWSHCVFCTLRLAAPRAAAIAAFMAALAYAALAGFTVPTQRALIMAAIVLAAIGFRPRLSPSYTLALALLLILLWDPLSVLGVGLWLSFAAVALLLYGMQGRLSMRSKWWRWGRVHWVASLGLMPLLLLFFQQASLTAPIANAVAVPWIGLVVVPLTLIGTMLAPLSLTLASGVLHLAGMALGIVWQLLQLLASWQPAYGLALPSIWTLPLAILAVAWLLAPRGWPIRWLGIVLTMPVFFMQPERPAPGAFWFTLLDVGQGLSAVIQTRGHVLVFDTGLGFTPGNDTGGKIIIPFLRYSGRTGVDTLVISHGDSDHIGGMETLLSQIHVQRLLTSAPGKMGEHPYEGCHEGQNWEWDGVRFSVLNPETANGESGVRRNNNSCVLRVSGASFSVLLTGDIEAPAERSLIQRTDRLHADILVVPHHGSKTSSTAPFITAVAPRLALFPLGYRNRYHFPAASVVASYRAAGIAMLDTASSGAITVMATDSGFSIEEYRAAHRRYWHSEPLH